MEKLAQVSSEDSQGQAKGGKAIVIFRAGQQGKLGAWNLDGKAEQVNGSATASKEEY